MADTEKRIVVEGVEYEQLVQFPKILRAVTASFQPSRLVLGLLMVAALMTVGRVWDGVTADRVPPAGLTAAAWAPEEAHQAQGDLRAVLARWAPEVEQPEGDVDAGEVLDAIHAAYRVERRQLVGQVEETEDGPGRLQARDEAYVAALEQVDSIRPRGIFEATVGHVTGSFNELVRGLVTLDLKEFFSGVQSLFVRTPICLWGHDKIFTIVYGLLFVLLVAVGGGALSRMAAVDVAQGEKLRLQEALDFALGGWTRLVLSLLLPLLIAAFLVVLLLVGGWFLMLPWVDVLGGLLYGVALLIGFGVVFLMVGYALGFSLLVPAVACENCDAADAQQRAYAYVLSRPLHLLGYSVVLIVGLVLGFVLASLFAVAMLNVTGALLDAVTANAAVEGAHGFALFDLSPGRTASVPLQAHSEWSAWLVVFWQTVVVSLVAGYVFANYFGASTIIYLLMRQACDGQEMSEIWQPGVVPGTAALEPVGPEAEDEAQTEER
ncbi:MAG: hypothetical protein ACYSWT_04850 [Planctomycetota bacterium]